MKPFRGKPEKPESSNGEIQRVSVGGEAWCCDGFTCVLALAASGLPRYACTSLLVGRRDPLGVYLRPVVEPVPFIGADPRCPGGLARRFERGAGPRPVRVRSVESTDGYLAIGPSADSGAARLFATYFSNRVQYALVNDAIALGTFRTRLETRTKESSMCASHWDLINLKAK